MVNFKKEYTYIFPKGSLSDKELKEIEKKYNIKHCYSNQDYCLILHKNDFFCYSNIDYKSVKQYVELKLELGITKYTFDNTILYNNLKFSIE